MTTRTMAVIYVRVSTNEQARDGVGLEAQEARCRAFCELRGFTALTVYADEAVSGRTDVDERPGLAAAVAHVRGAMTTRGSPPMVLVAYSVSRIARSQRVLWSLLDPVGAQPLPVASATEPFDTSTPMGRAMLGMIAVWSQLEADLVSERTKDALATVRASGKRLGAPPMRELAPEAVQTIARLRAEGLSLRAIAERLNAEGVRGGRGGQWWTKTIRAALAQAQKAAAPSRSSVPPLRTCGQMKVEDLGYNTPSRRQGQMVTVSYGYPCDGTVVRRTYDAADRTTRYDIASLDGAEDGVWCEEPSIIGRWRPIAADALLY